MHFFGWQPHVNCLTVDVYEDGWNELVKPERDLMISLKDEDAGEQIDEIYGYISNLIIEKSSPETAISEEQITKYST